MSIFNRKFLLLAILVTLSISASAQKEITKFLGIPIDGTKSEMIQKLKQKGFVSSTFDKDVLEGEFNGSKVNIYVVTNNNKVYRIMVADANSINETDIKIRFNKLCQQFSKNKKYIQSSLSSSFELSDDEDISYNMAVKKKRYEAIYYQIPEEKLDSVQIELLLSKYTKDQLSNPSEEIKKEIITTLTNYLLEISQNRPVWFNISEHQNKYYIAMFYDNECNRANGEDL